MMIGTHCIDPAGLTVATYKITYLLFSSLQLFPHTLRVSQAEPIRARSLLPFVFSMHGWE